MIRAGRLRHRVLVQALPASPALDGYGQTSSSFSTAATVWASIDPLSGNELVQARQVSADVTHRVVMRYHAGLTPKMRLKKGDRVFEILSVLDGANSTRRESVCLVKEVV